MVFTKVLPEKLKPAPMLAVWSLPPLFEVTIPVLTPATVSEPPKYPFPVVVALPLIVVEPTERRPLKKPIVVEVLLP